MDGVGAASAGGSRGADGYGSSAGAQSWPKKAPCVDGVVHTGGDRDPGTGVYRHRPTLQNTFKNFQEALCPSLPLAGKKPTINLLRHPFQCSFLDLMDWREWRRISNLDARSLSRPGHELIMSSMLLHLFRCALIIMANYRRWTTYSIPSNHFDPCHP